jgi:N-acyl-D-aspartate/D-glutamate deacylase
VDHPNSLAPGEFIMHDLLIKNGTIVDGTGQKAFKGDVALTGSTLTYVGPCGGAGDAKEIIDAEGKLVTPGFVDMHTHYDAQASWDPWLTPSSWHGVTTCVMGSCGVGFAPAKKEKHDWLIGLMEGVEDIPGAALAEGITWDWESFPEYLDALDKMDRVIDIAAQIPHGALRAYVMGERGADNEEATPEDIEKMCALVTEGLKAGAVGFSTSRTLLHKSIEGVPVPGTFASRDELFGIGNALRDAGHGVYQVASDHGSVPEETEWMKVLSMEIGKKVCFNLSQIDQDPKLYEKGLQKLEEAAEDGVELYAQCAGRSIGIVMCWQGTANPFIGFTEYLKVGWLPWEEQLAELRKDDVRAKIIGDEPQDLGEFANMISRGFHKMFPMKQGIEYEPSPSESVAAIAKRTGKKPEEIVYDALMNGAEEGDGKGLIYFPLFNYSNDNLDVVHKLHSHPRTFMGLSDAGAHCGAICDGGMPTFMLTHWTRDRKRGEKLSIEHIVHRQTQATAEMYGFMDRGTLTVGKRADINVIDYQKLGFERPELAWDLPAGGRRFIQKAKGYNYTLVAGEIVVENDAFTGKLPGKLVRGPQPGPSEEKC